MIKTYYICSNPKSKEYAIKNIFVRGRFIINLTDFDHYEEPPRYLIEDNEENREKNINRNYKR